VVVVTLTNPGDEPLQVVVARDDLAQATQVAGAEETTVAAYEVVSGGTSTVSVTAPGVGVDDEDSVLAQAISTHDCSPAPSVCDDVIVPFEPPAAEGTSACPTVDGAADPGTVPPGTGETETTVTPPAEPATATPGTVPSGTGETDPAPAPEAKSATPPADVTAAAPSHQPADPRTPEGSRVLAAAEVSQPQLQPPPPADGGSAFPSPDAPPVASQSPATSQDPAPTPDQPATQPSSDAQSGDPALAHTGSELTPLVHVAAILVLAGLLLVGAGFVTRRDPTPSRHGPARARRRGWLEVPRWWVIAHGMGWDTARRARRRAWTVGPPRWRRPAGAFALR
jgi:hypothetical protein